MPSDNEVILNDEEILDDGLSVSTDLDDYAPGSTAEITATGVDEGGSVTFEVEHVSDAGPDGIYGTADDTTVDLGGDGHDSWTVTDGGEGDLDGEANGVIVTDWYVNPDDSAGERFLLSAYDGTDTAFATFTDGIGDDAGAQVDLTGPELGSDTLNGAVYSNDAVGAGTGLINSFVRISTNDPEEDGYNTSDRPLDNDENNSPGFTRDLFFGDIPVVTLYDDQGNATLYLEFQLDINEPDSGATSYLSLDQVEIYVSDSQVPSGDPALLDTYGELVYSLDTYNESGVLVDDNWVALDYTLQSGSGVSDMILYVPLEFFEGATTVDVNDGTYVTLYSDFGHQEDYIVDGELVADWTNNSGFEEWSVRTFVEFTGIKFNDLDVDGVKDDTEVELGGWEIRAYIDLDRDGVLDQLEYDVGAYATDITDINGFYELNFFLDANVPYSELYDGPTLIEDAQYLIVEVMQDGWEQGPAGDPILDAGLNTGDEILGPNGYVFDPTSSDLETEVSGNNFGNYQPTGDITGIKYNDLAGDGASGTNTPISGWTVYLFEDAIDTSGDGSLSDAEIAAALSSATPVQTDTTDDSGVYLFEDVMVGDYFVIEDIDGPSGGWAPTTTPWYGVTVVGGETYGDGAFEATDFYNFELFDIDGTKFDDLDGDGSIEDGEPGLGGVTIFIDLDGNGEFDWTDTEGEENGVWDAGEGDRWTVTANDGTWSFTDLDWTYDEKTVYEVLPDGYVQTVGASGYEIDGTSGNDQSNLDFANFELASIEGYKFWDLDRSGTWDFVDTNDNGIRDGDEITAEGGESGAQGWTILLYKDDGDGIFNETTAIDSTVSDETGYWSFDGLMAGTYFVKEQLLAGYVQTTPDAFGDGYFKVVVDTSGQVVITDVEDNLLLFGNDQIDGPGVRTPGFWQGQLGQTYWDGNPDNDGIIPGTGNTEEKEGAEFAENDVIVMNYGGNFDANGEYVDGGDPDYWDRVAATDPDDLLLLIGDWNFDGNDSGEDWYKDGEGVTLTEALYALQGYGLDGTKDRGKNKDWGKTELIERDLVAAWLNVMAGNEYQTAPEDGESFETAEYWIDQAIAYLNYYYDEASPQHKKSAWHDGFNPDGIDGNGDEIVSGSEIHNALDGWNNSGELDGFYVAFDGDNGGTTTALSYFAAEENYDSVA
ncbi:hypothetical protein GCM10011517_19750 [Actibacterium pelagium]|uniref:Cna protein B-type domain-containing protein n=3 Tax=Actibacterium pelagium TaxID=2029103 RepID=A0A917AH25_9RHOB|nr:hypothetical protein [Actibacterium pelagium]GGE52068.1 hypothetical protein GCM10011517_19750 [Actibacterium pelagium]